MNERIQQQPNEYLTGPTVDCRRLYGGHQLRLEYEVYIAYIYIENGCNEQPWHRHRHQHHDFIYNRYCCLLLSAHKTLTICQMN